jgi:hypothetical protein
MNKKITLILASLLIISGIIFYSCKKEENANNSQSSQNKPSINNNKELRGIERLSDEEYVNQLIEISGIDPKKLSQDEAIWNPIHNALQAINACFIDKYIFFYENEPWNAAYCIDHLNLAVDYLTVGDTLNALISADQAYTKTGCGSLTPFFYQGHSIYLPALEIAQDIETYNVSEENLINKYPNLNKIDEQYKKDILTLAEFWYEKGQSDESTKAESCADIRSKAKISAKFNFTCCCAGALSASVLGPVICGAALFACSAYYGYECGLAENAYYVCNGNHW